MSNKPHAEYCIDDIYCLNGGTCYIITVIGRKFCEYVALHCFIHIHRMHIHTHLYSYTYMHYNNMLFVLVLSLNVRQHSNADTRY